MANHVPMLIATYQRKIICIWVNCKLYSCHGDLRITHWGIIFVEYEPPYMHLLSRHTLSWLCLYSLFLPLIWHWVIFIVTSERLVVSVPSITIKILVPTTKTVEETYLHNIDAKVSDNKIVASTRAIKLSENLSSSRRVNKSPKKKT